MTMEYVVFLGFDKIETAVTIDCAAKFLNFVIYGNSCNKFFLLPPPPLPPPPQVPSDLLQQVRVLNECEVKRVNQRNLQRATKQAQDREPVIEKVLHHWDCCLLHQPDIQMDQLKKYYRNSLG